MSDFFNDNNEKQTNNEEVTNSVVTDTNESAENIAEVVKEDTDESSTIFSDPTSGMDKKAVKNKKLLPKIIAIALCFCVLLGGTLLAVKLIPEKEDESSSSSKAEDTFYALELEEKDISSVKISNKKCEVLLTCTEQKGDSSDDSSESSTTYTWSLDGVADEKVNTYLTSTTAKATFSVKAKKKITEKTQELCGLDSPVITATVQKRDGESFSVSIGGDSPDGSGSYLKTSLSNDIYLVDSEIKENLTFDNNLYFASTDNVPSVSVFGNIDDYYTDGTLSKFDYITLVGTNFPETLKVIINSDEEVASALPYKVISPTVRYGDNIDSLMSIYESGISVSGAYSYDLSDASLAKFGLNNPDLTMSIGMTSHILTYKFKLQEDGSYAVWCNEGKLIYKVAASNCESIVNGKPTDYYSPLVCLCSIDDVSILKISANDKNYEFSISPNPNEDAEDKYIILYKGNNIDCSSFQNLYQQIVSISCYDYSAGYTTTEDKVNLTFVLNDGSIQTLEFLKNGESKYQCSSQGKVVGQITASSIKKIVKNLEKLVRGGK